MLKHEFQDLDNNQKYTFTFKNKTGILSGHLNQDVLLHFNEWFSFPPKCKKVSIFYHSDTAVLSPLNYFPGISILSLLHLDIPHRFAVIFWNRFSVVTVICLAFLSCHCYRFDIPAMPMQLLLVSYFGPASVTCLTSRSYHRYLSDIPVLSLLPV